MPDLAESKIVTRTVWAGSVGPNDLRVLCTHDTCGRLKPLFSLQWNNAGEWTDVDSLSARNLQHVLAGVYQQGALDALAKHGSAATP